MTFRHMRCSNRGKSQVVSVLALGLWVSAGGQTGVSSRLSRLIVAL